MSQDPKALVGGIVEHNIREKLLVLQQEIRILKAENLLLRNDRPKGLKLGSPVTISTKLMRRQDGNSRFWNSEPIPKTRGIIVGVRRLSDGHMEIDDAEAPWDQRGEYYQYDHHFKGVLVATRLDRNPFMVKLEKVRFDRE